MPNLLALLGVGPTLGVSAGGASAIKREADNDNFLLEDSSGVVLEEVNNTDTAISAYTDGGPVQPGDEFVVARGAGNNKVQGEDLVAMHFRDASSQSVSVTTETSIFSYSVPANELSTNRLLRLTIWGTVGANATATTTTFRVKFNGTTIYQDDNAHNEDTIDDQCWCFVIYLAGNNATNAQAFGGYMLNSTVTNPTTGVAGEFDADEIRTTAPVFNTAAQDQTSACTFEVTVQRSGTTSAFNIRNVYLERV
jgi:hypothetical protein